MQKSIALELSYFSIILDDDLIRTMSEFAAEQISLGTSYSHSSDRKNIINPAPSSDEMMRVIVNLIVALHPETEKPSILIIHDSRSSYSQVVCSRFW